jgi:Protein of unknown function (DUF2735)
MMATAIERPTAEIIQFPIGGLRAFRERGDRAAPKAPVEKARLSDLAFGGGWYHDEAINGPNPPSGKLS